MKDAAVEIAAHLGRLSDAQMAQLHLLEVRIHPQRVQRNHGHEGLTRLNVLTQLHAALGHVSGDRRHHGIALRGDPRVAVGGLGLQHRGVVFHLRAVHQRMRRQRLTLRPAVNAARASSTLSRAWRTSSGAMA